MQMHYMREIAGPRKGLTMGALFEIEATITERGQTTVPSAIRKALGVGQNGKIMFRQMDDGSVIIAPKSDEQEESDPVIAKFLAFLERDMSDRPERLAPLKQELLDRGEALVEGVEIDLDARLADE
jgi:antitoxin PrlF